MDYCREVAVAELLALSEILKHGALLRFFSGTVPSATIDPDPAICLAEIELPDPPFSKCDGNKLESTSWSGHGADAAGKGRLARSFRIVDNVGTCIVQGTVSEPEGSGDIKLGCPSIAKGQELTVTLKFILRKEKE
jgi:hypothetical protein